MSFITYCLKGANKVHATSTALSKHFSRLVVLVVILMLIINMIWFYTMTNSYERYLLGRNVNAWYQISLRQLFDNKRSLDTPAIKALTMQWHTYQGRSERVSLLAYKMSPYYRLSAKMGWRRLRQGLWVSAGIVWLLLSLYLYSLYRRGKRSSEKTVLTGHDKTSIKNLNRLLKKRKCYSALPIGNTRYVKGSEIEHTAVIGGTRMGKSVFMKWLVQKTIKLGHKRVIFDLDGEYTELFYRKGIDVILNPRDKRSPYWHLWAEAHDEIDINNIASSLIPAGNKGGNDKFWATSSQNIFAAVANGLREQLCYDTEALLRYLFSLEHNNIAEMVKGTESETLVAKNLEKMTGSIKAVLSTHIKCLKYLRPKQPNESVFSIRQWLQNDDNQNSTLFISVTEDDFETFVPLISLWLDIAARAIRSLSKNRTRRVWFIYDEIDTLQYLPSLQKSLTKAAKKGGCFVLGAQSVAQFVKNYGQTEAEIIFDNCGTKLYYRIAGAHSAKWAAMDLGEIEIEEERDGSSISTQKKGGANVSTNEQTRITHAVPYSDIKNADKLTAYLNLPGNWPIVQVTFNIFPETIVAPNIVPIEIKPLRVTDDVNHEKNTTLLEKPHLRFLEKYTPDPNAMVVDEDIVARYRPVDLHEKKAPINSTPYPHKNEEENKNQKPSENADHNFDGLL